MEQEIEPAPFLFNARKRGLKLVRLANIAGNDDWTFEPLGERAQVRLCPRIEIGDREFRASLADDFCAPECDAVLIGDPNDKPFLPAPEFMTPMLSPYITGSESLGGPSSRHRARAIGSVDVRGHDDHFSEAPVG